MEVTDKYILTSSCHYSRFMCLEPLKTKSAEEVGQAFEKIIYRMGIPKKFVCDSGSEFISQVFQAICDRAHIKKVHTSPHHPESNGACESSHREINKHLRLALQEYKRGWKETIPLMEFVHNSTPLAHAKFPPYYLMYHRWPTQLQDLPLLSQSAPSKKRADYQEYADFITERVDEARTIMLNLQLREKEARLIKSGEKRRIIEYNVDDEVLVWRPAAATNITEKTSAKLLWAAVGPMRVKAYKGKSAYLVENLATGREYRVNVRDIFPYCIKSKKPAVEDGSAEVPETLPLDELLDIDQCAEGQWVAVPRERRWFLAKILSYDTGSDEVKVHYYNTHIKNGRTQLKPVWYHPKTTKEAFQQIPPKGYLAYTETMERKQLYPAVVQVLTRGSPKSPKRTHEITRDMAADLDHYVQGQVQEVDQVKMVSTSNKGKRERRSPPLLHVVDPIPGESKSHHTRVYAIQEGKEGKVSNSPEVLQEAGSTFITPPVEPSKGCPDRSRRSRQGDPPEIGSYLRPRGLNAALTAGTLAASTGKLLARRPQSLPEEPGVPRKAHEDPHGNTDGICDHLPCHRRASVLREAQQDAPELFGDIGMTLQWLCNTCAANSAIHRTRRARAQEPGTITNGVVWHQMECEGCVEPGGPNIKDDPPETPFGKRTRPQSPDHSPEGLECKRNKESPGSGGKSTTRILRSTEKTRQSCILKECKLPVAAGMCPANGKPKQACCSRHYHLHKERKVEKSQQRVYNRRFDNHNCTSVRSSTRTGGKRLHRAAAHRARTWYAR